MASVGENFQDVKKSPYEYAGAWGGFGKGTWKAKQHALRKRILPKIKKSIKDLKDVKKQAFGGLGIDSPMEGYNPEITGDAAERKQRAGIELGGYSPVSGHTYKKPDYLDNTSLGYGRPGMFKVGYEAHHLNVAGKYHKWANPGVKVKVFSRNRRNQITHFKGKKAKATSSHEPSKSSIDSTNRATGAKQEFEAESFKKNPTMDKLFKSTAKRAKKREKVARGILGDI
jgi:hypothetical protein